MAVGGERGEKQYPVAGKKRVLVPYDALEFGKHCTGNVV